MVFSWKMVMDGAKIAKKYAVKYAPQILTGIGIGLMAGATVHAIATAPKAKAALDKIEDDPDLNHKQYILKKTRTLAAFYWPELLMTFGGAGLIIGGQHISLKRLGMATAIISTQREEIKDLKDKVAEKFGNKKLTEIEDEITKDKVSSILNSSEVYNTGKGTTLFCDAIGQRLFYHDLERIRQERDAANHDISEQQQHGHEAVMSLNDWYSDYLGLPPLDGRIDGKKMGPNIGKDMGWRNRLVQLRFTSILLPNDQTCMVLGYTDNGGPQWDMNISDDYGLNYEDDETDMRWRGQ